MVVSVREKARQDWVRYGTWKPVVPMLRKKSEWRPHKDESTDAEWR
jgi:hypothetical protein